LLDDSLAPYEISDAAIDFRIDEAVREACVRSNLIVDSSTAAICDIAVVAGTNTYNISELILDIHRASLPSAVRPLKKRGYKLADDTTRNWGVTAGTPDGYLLDMDVGKLVLSHVPIINETLTLTVSRLPLTDLADDDAVPVIKSTYHYDLVYWVLHLTYNTRDSQIYDPNDAAKYEALFERRFGKRKTAEDIERNLRRSRRRGKAQWL